MHDNAGLVEVLSATASPGQVRSGHGLAVRMAVAHKFLHDIDLKSTKIDVSGPAFDGLSAGERMLLARALLLPFRVHRLDGMNELCAPARLYEEREPPQADAGKVVMLTFVLGARKLSYATLHDLLARLEQGGGDPLFVIELTVLRNAASRRSPLALVQIATRPSLIRASLRAGGGGGGGGAAPAATAPSLVSPERVPPELARLAARRCRSGALRTALA